MELKHYKPKTSGLRNRIIINKKGLSKYKTINKLTFGLINNAGKNHSGKITCYHRGGGNKKKYRIIDFKYLFNLGAVVKRLEYDPNRTGFIALICYLTGIISYIVSPKNLKVGDSIVSGNYGNLRVKIGYSLPLLNIPLGSFLSNIELKPYKGSQFLRAAGTYCILLKKYNNYAYIRLRSGEYRYIPIHCFAMIGIVSNYNYKYIRIGKAGVKRWMNKRPIVRGVAMNPVDHPHGGRTPGGRPSVHFKGRLLKGMLTRNRRLTNKLIVKLKN